MFRKIVLLTVIVIMLVGPVVSFSQSESNEGDIESLVTALAQLQTLVNQLTEQMKKMTPEEREKFCRDLQTEAIKNPPAVPVQINCN